MECISCESSEVLNRVVINQLSGVEHGVYCEACERDTFGNLLNETKWHQPNGCAFCSNPGKYKLPLVDCIIEYSDGETEFQLNDVEECVALCTAHTDSLSTEQVELKNTGSNDEEPPITIEV